MMRHELRKILSRAATLAALLAAPFVLGACTVSAGVDPGPPPLAQARVGTLEVQWSIDGSFDPRACNDWSAFDMRLVVYDTAGRIVSDTAAACQNFSMRVGLYQGSYTATATMLDPSGSPRTTTINLQPFTIVSDTTLVLDTDFPRNSFF